MIMTVMTVVLQVSHQMKMIVNYTIRQDEDKVWKMKVKINYSRNSCAARRFESSKKEIGRDYNWILT